MAQQLTGLQLSTPRFDPQTEQIQVRFEATEDGFATLVVFSPDGAWLLSLGETRIQTGTNTVTWHGLDSDGGMLPDGGYALELFGFDRSHRPAAAAALRTQVEVCNYSPKLATSGRKLRLTRFHRDEAPTPTDAATYSQIQLRVYATT